MKPSEYEFNIGDTVITTLGEVGHIIDICKCSECKRREFYEPIWVENGSRDKMFITKYIADGEFAEFYQIGKYRFNHRLNKPYVLCMINHYKSMLAEWERNLNVIDSLEKERD